MHIVLIAPNIADNADNPIAKFFNSLFLSMVGVLLVSFCTLACAAPSGYRLGSLSSCSCSADPASIALGVSGYLAVTTPVESRWLARDPLAEPGFEKSACCCTNGGALWRA